MQKRIITLLCAVGLALSAPAMAQMKLRADAPARYEVKSGDTLWGISGKYLHQPWQWPLCSRVAVICTGLAVVTLKRMLT